MAAEVLAQGGADVTVYDAMPSAGRKFLMAGRGGLNLTHSEPLPQFLARYREATPHLTAAIEAFPPEALRDWSEALGQPTFVGSSGRVFPKAFKASPLLRAWLRRLDSMGVQFALRHRWTGWDDSGRLLFQTPDGQRAVESRATVLALGGASWPRLGSDGAWVETLAAKGVDISPLRPANCGFTVAWSDIFRDRFEGQPLKGVALSIWPAHRARRGHHHPQRHRGRRDLCAVGGVARGARACRAAHAQGCLAARSRDEGADRAAVGAEGQTIPVQFPAQSRATLARRDRPVAGGGQGIRSRRLASLSPADLADLINAVPIELNGVAPIARAISTAGGISFSEIDADFMLRRLPGVFAAGEMLDWEAPTGGYLLQASFATGAAAGRGVLKWLGKSQGP